MNSQDKLSFIKSVVNNNAKLKFLSKQGLDIKSLLSQYGGVASKEVSVSQIEADFPILQKYNIAYNQSLIKNL
ncbi:MAG: hypothetical protein EKK57_00785 [Proteobacteria bacterium]|nr:MAG: hypothetical protein EKK57_00785 [Pseudomonadota bacterium]